MVRKLVSLVLGLALLGGVVVAQGEKGARDKGKAKDKDARVITGTVKAVDETKGTLTISVEGKDMVFLISKDTKIVGPRGGVSAVRLKDDRLGKGSEVKITPSADGKSATEVKLGYRKRKTPTKDDDKGKAKDKAKTKDKAKAKDKGK